MNALKILQNARAQLMKETPQTTETWQMRHFFINFLHDAIDVIIHDPKAK